MIKRRINLYIILVMLAACNSPAKDEAKNPEESKEDSALVAAEDKKREINSISAVRQEYKEIIQAIEGKEFSSTSVKFDCRGAITGTITFHTEDDKVRMVEKTYNEYSHRDATEQYFVTNDQPFFIYFKTTDWVFDSGGSSGVANATRDNIKENRYYFVNDSLVSCLEKNYVIRSASTDNPNPDEVENKTIACPSAEELLASYKKLLEYRNEEGELGYL